MYQSSDSDGASTPASEIKEFIRSQNRNYFTSTQIATQQRHSLLQRQMYQATAPQQQMTAGGPTNNTALAGYDHTKHSKEYERDYYNFDLNQFLSNEPPVYRITPRSEDLAPRQYDKEDQAVACNKPQQRCAGAVQTPQAIEDMPKYVQALQQRIERDRQAYEDTIKMLEAENIELTNRYIEEIRTNNELCAKLQQTKHIYESGLVKSLDDISTNQAAQNAIYEAGSNYLAKQSQQQDWELKELQRQLKRQQEVIERQTAQQQHLMKELSGLRMILHERYEDEKLRQIDSVLSFQ